MIMITIGAGALSVGKQGKNDDDIKETVSMCCVLRVRLLIHTIPPCRSRRILCSRKEISNHKKNVSSRCVCPTKRGLIKVYPLGTQVGTGFCRRPLILRLKHHLKDLKYYISFCYCCM